MSTSPLPKQMLQDLRETLGPDRSRWPQEALDLFDTTIEAELVAPAESGRVLQFLNTDYHYHWAGDSATDHTRVESLRSPGAGWEVATTDDVVMANESAVCNRDKNRKSRDGKGFSNEIRSGDRLLMKIPMNKWRAHRKAQNLAALQMAYPQAFGATGEKMTASNLVPGVRSEMLTDGAAVDKIRSSANSGNSVLAQRPSKES